MDQMDQKALLNRKKQMLVPYTAFVMRMFQKFKGTEHESLYSIMYETITNDRKSLTNAQIDRMKAQLLDLQLKEASSQACKGQQSGTWIQGGSDGGTRNGGSNGLYSRRDSVPPEHRNDFNQASTSRSSTPFRSRETMRNERKERKLLRKEVFTKNLFELKSAVFRNDHQSSSSTPNTRDSVPNGKLFSRRNPDAGYSLDTPPRDSRSPGRNSFERSRDPRLNRNPRSEKELSSESSPRDRSVMDKSTDAIQIRGKSRDPRLNRESRDPRLNRSSSKERDGKIDDRKKDQGEPSEHKKTGGWFSGTGQQYLEPRHSKPYANKGWFERSREQRGTSDRYRSPSRHQSRPRSRSKSRPRSRSKSSPRSRSKSRPRSRSKSRPRSRSPPPQSRNPQSKFWNSKKTADHWLSRKVENINSRINKSMPRSPQRHSVFGGPSFNGNPRQSQGRAQTERCGAENKRYNPDIDGRRKLHHGMLRDIKDFIVDKKKPPLRRMSCYEPEKPEVSEKPESFGKIRQRRMSLHQPNDDQAAKEPEITQKPQPLGKIRQRRMSLHQPSDDTAVKKAPSWITDGSLHPKFDDVNVKVPGGPEPPTHKEAPYPKASEISVGTSRAIVAAKKILSTKHAEPDDIAKHLVDVFGPELFIAALKKQLGSKSSDDDATTMSDTQVKEAVKETPLAPAVQEPPKKAPKAEKPTKVIKLTTAEVMKPSTTEMSQDSSEVDQSAPAAATDQKSTKKIPPRRNSIGVKPGPKKKEKLKNTEPTTKAKSLESSKVIKYAKNDQKDVAKPVPETKSKVAESSKSSAAIAEDEAKPVDPPPVKRKRRKGNELDKLHDQIKDFFDGSEIASLGSKRSCTKQPHNYTGEQISPEIPKVRAKTVKTTQEQLVQYNIKSAKITLKRLQLDGVPMPVKLDSEDRPIIPKTLQLPTIKLQSPITAVKTQKKSSKLVGIVTPPVVAEASPKSSPKAKKRSSMWTQGVIAKKLKKTTSPDDDDDAWEDLEDDIKSSLKDSTQPEKKVLLKVLVKCMNLWSKSIVRVKKPEVKNVPVTARPICPFPNEPKPQAKPAPLTKLLLKPTATKSPSSPKNNFAFNVTKLGNYSYQCKLCLFNSETTGAFINHIKASHTLVHYPKPCPRCGTKSDGTMESEFRHALTHYPSTQKETPEKPVAAKVVAAPELLTLKALPGDRLSKISSAPVKEASTVVPPVQPVTAKPSVQPVTAKPSIQPDTGKPPGLQIVLNKHQLFLPSKPPISLPSVVKPITANSSPVSAPVTLKLLPMPTGLRQPVPINFGYKPMTAPAKVYRVVKSAVGSSTTELVTHKKPETKQQVSGNVQESSKPVTTTVTVSKHAVASAQLKSMDKKQSKAESVPIEMSDSPNLQFYAEQVTTLAKTTIVIHPVYPDLVLRPWLKEQSAKSNVILQEMLRNPKCMAALFKCMGSTCSFYTGNVAVFHKHLAYHRAQQISDEANFMCCAYCTFKAESVGGLTTHIIREHGYDRFQCAYCFFRAYSDFHIFLSHQSTYHKLQPRSLIECATIHHRDISVAGLQTRITKNVPPLKCFFCLETFFIESSYLTHLQSHDDASIDFQCKKCSGRVNISNVLEHFQCYGIGHYQCVYCFFGSKDFQTLDTHVAEKHSSEVPFVIQRIFSKTTTAHPSTTASLAVMRINKTCNTCMRISFKPNEINNSGNVEEIYGKPKDHCKEEPKLKTTAIAVTGPQNTSIEQTAEVIATTSAGSASTLMISNVVSLSDPVIVLSSDEE